MKNMKIRDTKKRTENNVKSKPEFRARDYITSALKRN